MNKDTAGKEEKAALSTPSLEGLVKKHLLLLKKGSGDSYVFIVPGVGGKCEDHHQLANAINSPDHIYGLQMMGIFRNEKPLQGIPEIAAQHIQWMRSLQPHGPYRLIGHSFGGNVAYEMTRQLEDLGEKVDFVAVLDMGARIHSKPLAEGNMLEFAYDIIGGYLEGFGFISQPYPEWTGELAAHLAGLDLYDMPAYLSGYLPARFDSRKKDLQLMVRLINLRFYNDLMEYTPHGQIDAELILFRSQAHNQDVEDESYGWSPFTQQFRSIPMPGDHFMVNNDNAKVVAEYLQKRLSVTKTAAYEVTI